MEHIENAILMVDALKWWIGFVVAVIVGTGIYERKHQN